MPTLSILTTGTGTVVGITTVVVVLIVLVVAVNQDKCYSHLHMCVFLCVRYFNGPNQIPWTNHLMNGSCEDYR